MTIFAVGIGFLSSVHCLDQKWLESLEAFFDSDETIEDDND